MPPMERLKMFLVSALAICVLVPLACVFLAGLHAQIGWYYGMGLFLSGLAVWRTMAPPGAGIRIGHQRSKPRPSTSHVNPPNA